MSSGHGEDGSAGSSRKYCHGWRGLGEDPGGAWVGGGSARDRQTDTEASQV